MKSVLIILGMVVLLCLIGWAYFGGFYPVKVQVAQAGGETIVFKSVQGDYRQSKAMMDALYQQLKDDYQIEAVQGIGVYYDNPKQVPAEQLRSDLGCVLPASALDRLEELKTSFEVKTLDKKEYLTAEFPFRGAMSVMMNILKTYPALGKFAAANGYDSLAPIIEIYDQANHKIYVRQEARRISS